MEVKPKLSWTWDCPKCRTPYVLWKSAPETLNFGHSCPLCNASWEFRLPDEVYHKDTVESKPEAGDDY